MRETRAVRAGSGDCALDVCWSEVRTLERLFAESLGERNEEPQTPAASRANTAVKRIRAFVVVDLMCDLMGENRTTFESDTIRLVGRGNGERGLRRCSLLAEEIDEEFGNACGLFVLKPVRGVGEGVEFGVVAIAETVVGHFGEEESVAHAPEDARGDMYRGIRKFRAMAERGAIPVNHARECSGFRPRGAVLGEIFVGEGVGAAGADQRADAEAEIESGECGLGNKGKLEEKHVPTAAKLAAVCFQVAAHDARVGDVENGELRDALRMEESDAPRNSGAPIVAGEGDALLAELIGDGENVGSEFGNGVRGGAAGFAAYVVAALIGNDHAEACGGERFNLFVPGIPEFGKAVEKDDDGTIWRASSDSMEFNRAVA
jgi:hypothetical protein